MSEILDPGPDLARTAKRRGAVHTHSLFLINVSSAIMYFRDIQLKRLIQFSYVDHCGDVDRSIFIVIH